MKPFVVDVADLVHRPGARRIDLRDGPTGPMQVAETYVDEGAQLTVEARFEPVGSGILATGWGEVEWRSECRRCAKQIRGTTRAAFQEEFAPGAAVDGDTYPMQHDQVDLELVAREAILLDLPLAPLCRADCAGLCPTCGADRNDRACGCVQVTADPRWDALSALSFGGRPADDQLADDRPDDQHTGEITDTSGGADALGARVEEG